MDAGVAFIPAVMLWVGMLFVPETPRWYAIHGRCSDAEAALRRVREPQQVPQVLHRIEEMARRPHSHEGRSGWVYLRARWVRVLLIIGVGIGVCQQITGINTVIYYAPTILESTGLAARASITASIAIGVVGVLAVTLGMWLVGRVNRRPMLIVGLCGTTTSLLTLALCFLLPSATWRSYLLLGIMLVFVAFQQSSISVVTWLVMSELFPLKIRGFAMGVAVFVLWMVNFAISISFPVITTSVGPTWTFLIFVALGVLAIAFVSTTMPETRGRSLEELEDGFRARYSS